MYELNEDLKKYISEEIFPKYNLVDKGHGSEHIDYVIRRSLEFAKSIEGINYDMVYTIAAYHDLGNLVDRERHEEISAQMFLEDDHMKNFFNDEERTIIKEAIEDHRASLKGEPRSIYGKIVSSADRNTSVKDCLLRTYHYGKKHFPDYSMDEQVDRAIGVLDEKFNLANESSHKMFFEDREYDKFLEDLNALLKDREEFKKEFLNACEED